MDTTTAIVIAVAAIVILVLIGIAFVLNRRSRLNPLPAESRERYAQGWRAVETRFFDDPRGAVDDADKLAVRMLGERGATIHDDRKVPDDLKHARAAASSDEGRQGTEGMRKAMSHYKRIVEDGIGSTGKSKEETSRREVAS